jgi:hypothetical protein
MEATEWQVLSELRQARQQLAFVTSWVDIGSAAGPVALTRIQESLDRIDQAVALIDARPELPKAMTSGHDELAEFLMDNIDVDVQYGNPVVDFPGLAAAIRSHWRLAPIPKGHVRERIDPRRDIEPHGPVRCVKCQAVVARYHITEDVPGELTVTYEPLFTPPQPCID